MKQQLKYLKLFESSDLSEDQEFIDFLDSIEVAHWDGYPIHRAFSESTNNPHDKYRNLTYSLNYGDEGDIGEDGLIKIENLDSLVKWSDTPFGKYYKIWCEDFYYTEINISHNPNLIELDNFNFDVISEDNTSVNIFIETNPKLKSIQMTDDFGVDVFLGIKYNPNLIIISTPVDSDTYNLTTPIIIEDCPKLLLAYILYLMNPYTLNYENNGVTFEIEDGDIPEYEDMKLLPRQEIFNIKEFKDIEYVEILPMVFEYFDWDDDIINEVFRKTDGDVLKQIVDKYNDLTQYLHLYHPAYKSTSGRDVAKLNTGQIYGIF